MTAPVTRRRWTDGPLLWLLPSVIVLLLISLYPQIYSLVNSFRFYNLGVAAHPLGFVGGDNYLAAFSDTDFLDSLVRTTLFAVGSTAAEILLGLLIALLLREKLRGVRLARSLLIMPTAIAPAIAGLAFRSMYDPAGGLIPYVLHKMGIGVPAAGILGSGSTALTAVAITDVWQWTPFAALILLAAMQGISGELLEAARIDGANAWQVFRSIVLPLIRPVLITVTLLRFISTFNVFDIIFVETRGGPGVSTTVSGLDVYYNGLTYYNIGYASALTWIITILVAIVINVYLATAGRKGR
jgi:multiple sugar transport system permease protein